MSVMSFDRVSSVYDVLSKLVYGNSIRDAQVYFLDQIKSGSKVLVLGGGTGWLLDELAKVNLNIEVEYVEASNKMLEKSRKYGSLPFSKLNYILGTEISVEGNSYDFIITPFVLDVFPQTQMLKMVSRVKDLLKVKGSWLCVDFNSHDRSIKAKLLSFVMIQFFRLLSGLQTKTVLDYFGAIRETKMKEVKSAFFYGQFIKASLYKK
tara:strand:- start:994 stop:1614 length:621 start_codon:yes stop_codon:yes gene_type:complete